MSSCHRAPSSNRRLLVLYTIAVVPFYWAAQYVFVPTLSVYVESKAANLASVGVVLSMYGLWQAIVRLPLGIAADWVARRSLSSSQGLLPALPWSWGWPTACRG